MTLIPPLISAMSRTSSTSPILQPPARMTPFPYATLFRAQFSAASHRSTAARQTVLEGRKALAGQVVLVPVQVSAASKSAAHASHTVPQLHAGCRQVVLVPLQMSRVEELLS